MLHFLSYLFGIETTNTLTHNRSSFVNHPDSRPKWAKSILACRLKRPQNPTRWAGTYPHGLYKGVPPRAFVWPLAGFWLTQKVRAVLQSKSPAKLKLVGLVQKNAVLSGERCVTSKKGCEETSRGTDKRVWRPRHFSRTFAIFVSLIPYSNIIST